MIDFIHWHYSKGLNIYFKACKEILQGTLRFFSLPILVNTLFEPWKRLIVHTQGTGFSLNRAFDDFTFNVTSRLVGFFVRSWLIILALLAASLFLLISIPIFFFWFFIPWLSYYFYKKDEKQASVYANKLVEEICNSSSPIQILFNNEAGYYVLAHTGLKENILIEKSIKHLGLDISKSYEGYADILNHVIEGGVWSAEFWKEVDVLPADLILAGRIWDTKRNIAAAINIGPKVDMVKGIGVELLFGYTPTIDKYGTELRLNSDGPEVLRGRDDILTRIDRILSSKSSVLLMGIPGVGKNSILLELAQRLDHEYQRLIEVSIVNLTEGVIDKNERKLVIQRLLSEAAHAGNVTLVIKDLPRLTNQAIEGMDFTDIFENQLNRKHLQIIAVTTPEEYEKFISRNFRLMKYFEKVEVDPLDSTSATQVLIDRAAKLESETGVTIPIPILRKMVISADRYFSETPFPKKAVELLESCIAYVRHLGKDIITFDDVKNVISEKTGIPLNNLTEQNKYKLANIESLMHENLVGQDTAIKLIAKSLRSRTMGVSEDNKPIGSFLFLGPTGVGKTETAKVLSKMYYGHSDIMRFDMAEYVGLEGMTKLIGSMQLNQPGILTTAIRNNPAGMILLDELEKASKDIFNVLLTLFDEGYIMDAFGRKIDCRNVFIIATSNAGSELIRELVTTGIYGDELQQQVLEHVLRERIFSPEFINRFDGVVVYEPLSFQDLMQIATIHLKDLKQRMSEKNIHLEFHEYLTSKIAEDGYDPIFGARPMRRIVDMVIGDLISQALLSDNIHPGDKVQITPGREKHEYFIERL
jgi:ATP-dependent Clp protease ATP-binding subunit ClpA